MEGSNPVTINDLWSPITYMDGRDLVNVNNCYGPQNLIWNAGTLYLLMTVLVPQYLIWNAGTFYLPACNCQ